MQFLQTSNGVQVTQANLIEYSQELKGWIVDGELYADFDGTQYLVSGQQGSEPETPQPTPNPVPAFVTPRQARLVLALTPSGDENFPTMLAKVEAAFNSLPEPDKTVAQITWEYSTEVQRNNPLIAQMQAVIGFTSEQIDELFIQAATL